jgi:hypothetical protein
LPTSLFFGLPLSLSGVNFSATLFAPQKFGPLFLFPLHAHYVQWKSVIVVGKMHSSSDRVHRWIGTNV